jgi:hypothetical protein
MVGMPGGYILCEYESVKREFPEFKAVMDSLKASLVEKARADWGIPAEKMTLKSGYLTTVIPALFRGQQTTAGSLGTQLTTWNQWLESTAAFPIPGSGIIMTGSGSGGTIPEDFKVGFAGLAFLDAAIRISEIKMQISETKLPRINLEEAFAYNKPAIIFEEGFILDEKQAFELYAYVLTQGPQRIKLIGLQANRVKDKLFTVPGAAI